MTSADDLLRTIEPLSHGDRCRHLSTLTRPDAEVISELAARGSYERRIALHLAVAAGDAQHVTRALSDPDPAIAGPAAVAAVRLGLPVSGLVLDGSLFGRMSIYRAIRVVGASELAEALIDVVRERWGDREAASLLPACGPDAVALRLDDLAHAVRSWGALAKRHPGPFLDHAERTLASLPGGLREAWWARHGDGVAAASDRLPERVITLLEQHWTATELPAALVGRAGRLLDDSRFLGLLLVPRRRATLAALLEQRAVRRRLAALPDELLGAVGRAVQQETDALGAVGRVFQQGTDALATLLAAVAPSRREALFEAAMAGVDLGQAMLQDDIVDALPATRRYAEARRMSGLAGVRTDPYQLAWATSHLPYDEAEPLLRAWTRRPDATGRSFGYRYLIACAGRTRSPEVLTALLPSLDRLANDQDPVRQAAASALAAIPPTLIEPVHLPALAQMISDALAARDVSHHTCHSFAVLAARVFQQGALREEQAMVDFALDAFDRLSAHDVIPLGLASVLRKGQERALGDRLATRLRADAAHDRYRLAFRLVSQLGRRWHNVPALQEAIKAATRDSRDDVARRAIELWLEPPATRSARVEKLLRRDRSAAALPSVFNVLAWHRTDLLDVAIGRKRPKGRFAGKARRVHYAPGPALRRWTGAQREAYQALVRTVADNPALGVWERADAVRHLGGASLEPVASAGGVRPLGSTSLEPVDGVRPVAGSALEPYLAADEPLVRRAALTALPWSVAPGEALEVLLSHAGGPDAHVALYAAARAARFTPPALLGAALEPVLREGKVTARKEAVRLLARHRVPGAAARLRTLWETEGQHRDVLGAIAASCALYLLDDPEVWPLLTTAVTGPSIERPHPAPSQPTPAEPPPAAPPPTAAAAEPASGIAPPAPAGSAPEQPTSAVPDATPPTPAEPAPAVLDAPPPAAAEPAPDALPVAASGMPAQPTPAVPDGTPPAATEATPAQPTPGVADPGVVGPGVGGTGPGAGWGADVAGPVLQVRPLDLPPRWREPYAELVVTAAHSADGDVRRVAVEVLDRWAPYAPEAVRRLADLVLDLEERALWRDAARGLVRSARSGYGLAELEAVVAGLSAAPPEPDAEATRDRPAAQRLNTIVKYVGMHHLFDPDSNAAVVAQIAPALPTPLAARLIATNLRWTTSGQELDALAALDLGGVLAAESVAQSLALSLRWAEPEEVLPHATRLTEHDTLTAGLLACSLVAECGDRAGWPEPWRTLLRHLRASPWPDVAHQAERTHTAPE